MRYFNSGMPPPPNFSVRALHPGPRGPEEHTHFGSEPRPQGISPAHPHIRQPGPEAWPELGQVISRHPQPGPQPQPISPAHPHFIGQPGPEPQPHTISPSHAHFIGQPGGPEPQVISSREYNALPLGGESQLPAHSVRTNSLPPGAERYPNPSVSAAEESPFPSHASFRTDVVDPQVIGQRGHTSGPRERQKKKPTPAKIAEDISTEVEGIIEELSSKEKFLPSDAIRKVAMGLLNKATNQTGVRIQLKDIEALTKFSRLHGRIDELIKVYCLFTPVTSAHELGMALAQAEKVDSYEELKLGPLIKHPRVRDYFKPPDDIDSPPEITVHQLHFHLTKLIDKSKRGSKHSLEDYLEFMRKKQGLETIAHLCVRVQSFPLLIQVR